MVIINNISNIYKFNKNFTLNLDINNKILIINIRSQFFILKLPSIFFVKKESDSWFFLFLNKFYYITFIKHLFNYYNIFFSLYFFNLKLKGLGFRVFIITKSLIKIFLNRSNYYYLHIPKTVLLKYKTRRFFFLSNNYNDLKVLILNLLFLKEFIIYRVSGIYYLRQIILIKPGKNKFR